MKKLFTKLLLLGVFCLMGGVNALAEEQTAFTQDFTGTSTDPADYGFSLSYGSGSNSTLVNMTVGDGKLTAKAGPYASSSAGARTGTALATFTEIGLGNSVTLSYTWELGSATGNTSGSYTETYIGNASGRALDIKFLGSDSDGKLTVNGTVVMSGDAALRSTTIKVTAVLDLNTQKITSLILDNSNNTFDYTATEAINFASPITSIDRFGFENSERQNWQNVSSIDDILVTYEAQSTPVNSIVVNYKYNDETIYTDNIDATGLTVGDKTNIPFRNYIVANGELFHTNNNSTDPYYADKNVTLTLNNVINKSLTKDNIEGGTIEHFIDLDGAVGNNGDKRGSYGSVYDNTAYTSANEIPAGVYKFIVRTYNRSRKSVIKVGDQTVIQINTLNASWNTHTIRNIVIPTAGKIMLTKGTGSTIDPVDIIIAIRLGDIPTNAGDDATFFINNPSFESNNSVTTSITGWTNNNSMQTQTNGSFDNHKGNVYVEKWVDSTKDPYVLPDASISQTVDNLPNGFYKLSAYAYFGGTGAYIKANGNVKDIPAAASGLYSVIAEVTDGTLAIEAGVKNATANWVCFDAFTLTYIGTSVPVTISAAGYATFVTPYAMDFGASDVMTAYRVKEVNIGSSKIILEEVTEVPAGEAIIVKGETDDIPVITSAAGIENELIPVTAEAGIAAPSEGAGKFYVLAQEGGNVVFAPVIAGTTIAKGKGYLSVPAGSMNLSIAFDDFEITGIEGNESEAEAVELDETAPIYNLSGVQVDKSYNGIKVQNGIKVK